MTNANSNSADAKATAALNLAAAKASLPVTPQTQDPNQGDKQPRVEAAQNRSDAAKSASESAATPQAHKAAALAHLQAYNDILALEIPEGAKWAKEHLAAYRKEMNLASESFLKAANDFRLQKKGPYITREELEAHGESALCRESARRGRPVTASEMMAEIYKEQEDALRGGGKESVRATPEKVAAALPVKETSAANKRIPCPCCGGTERLGTRGIGPEWRCKSCDCMWKGEEGQPAAYTNNPVWEKMPQTKQSGTYKGMMARIKRDAANELPNALSGTGTADHKPLLKVPDMESRRADEGMLPGQATGDAAPSEGQNPRLAVPSGENVSTNHTAEADTAEKKVRAFQKAAQKVETPPDDVGDLKPRLQMVDDRATQADEQSRQAKTSAGHKAAAVAHLQAHLDYMKVPRQNATAMVHLDKYREHLRLAKELEGKEQEHVKMKTSAANSNPEGINQYTKGGGKAGDRELSAEEYSKRAQDASKRAMTKSERAEAADSHMAAAEARYRASDTARKRGDHANANLHLTWAKSHEKHASGLRATDAANDSNFIAGNFSVPLDGKQRGMANDGDEDYPNWMANYKRPVLEESAANASDGEMDWITVNGQHIPIPKGKDKGEAIKEHFEKKKEGGSNGSKGGSRKSGAESDSDKAQEETDKANKAGTAEAHAKAREMHAAARGKHEQEAKRYEAEGNKGMADYHRKMVKWHETGAYMHGKGEKALKNKKPNADAGMETLRFSDTGTSAEGQKSLEAAKARGEKITFATKSEKIPEMQFDPAKIAKARREHEEMSRVLTGGSAKAKSTKFISNESGHVVALVVTKEDGKRIVIGDASAVNEWEEDKHPRGKGGKFTSGGDTPARDGERAEMPKNPYGFKMGDKVAFKDVSDKTRSGTVHGYQDDHFHVRDEAGTSHDIYKTRISATTIGGAADMAPLTYLSPAKEVYSIRPTSENKPNERNIHVHVNPDDEESETIVAGKIVRHKGDIGWTAYDDKGRPLSLTHGGSNPRDAALEVMLRRKPSIANDAGDGSVLRQLAVRLRSLQLLAHNAHNLTTGETFQQDHAFFGTAYDKYTFAYDQVIERMVGNGETVDANAMQQDAVDLLPDEPQTPEGYYDALLEGEDAIQELVNGAEGLDEADTQLTGDIANDSKNRSYQMKQRTAANESTFDDLRTAISDALENHEIFRRETKPGNTNCVPSCSGCGKGPYIQQLISDDKGAVIAAVAQGSDGVLYRIPVTVTDDKPVIGSALQKVKNGFVAANENVMMTNPPWVQDDDKWEAAKAAAAKTYDEDDDAFYPVVTSIYKKMSGRIKGAKDGANSDDAGGRWVTMNGRPVLIKDGESAKEAADRAFGKSGESKAQAYERRKENESRTASAHQQAIKAGRATDRAEESQSAADHREAASHHENASRHYKALADKEENAIKKDNFTKWAASHGERAKKHSAVAEKGGGKIYAANSNPEGINQYTKGGRGKLNQDQETEIARLKEQHGGATEYSVAHDPVGGGHRVSITDARTPNNPVHHYYVSPSGKSWKSLNRKTSAANSFGIKSDKQSKVGMFSNATDKPRHLDGKFGAANDVTEKATQRGFLAEAASRQAGSENNLEAHKKAAAENLKAHSAFLKAGNPEKANAHFANYKKHLSTACNIKQHFTLANEGTSDGAKKGWETRRAGGSSGDASPSGQSRRAENASSVAMRENTPEAHRLAAEHHAAALQAHQEYVAANPSGPGGGKVIPTIKKQHEDAIRYHNAAGKAESASLKAATELQHIRAGQLHNAAAMASEGEQRKYHFQKRNKHYREADNMAEERQKKSDPAAEDIARKLSALEQLRGKRATANETCGDLLSVEWPKTRYFANETAFANDQLVQLSPFGKFPNPQGMQVVTPQDGFALKKDFESIAALPDYAFGLPWYVGHPDHPAFKERDKNMTAVGRTKKIEVRVDPSCPKCRAAMDSPATTSVNACHEHGIFGWTKFNPKGKEIIANEEFNGHSIHWGLKQRGDGYHPVKLKSVGFTNNKNMPVRPVTTAQ